MIAMIAAMAHDRVIGKDNAMPWHLPADLAHFKQVTLGKPVIMGRRTFESIGRPLPGRTNIVISQRPDWQHPGVKVARGPEQALSLVGPCEEVMVIGGNQIYELFMPRANRLYLTEIDLAVEGDTRFPEIDRNAWQEVSRQAHQPDARNAHPFSFVVLERKG